MLVKHRKTFLISAVGNALEIYDFTLYGVFAPIIALLYFPAEQAMISYLANWGAYASGFLMRPLGALIFGSLGDSKGRQIALSISILLMGLPTFLIGALPTFEVIGIAAPIILVLCRLLQGFSAGGEYNGAAIYALEHVGVKPGMTGGFITASCVVGAILATAFGAIATAQWAPDWAWRVPFLLGALISVLGYYIRRQMSETPEFIQSSTTDHHFSLKNLWINYKGSLSVSFWIGAMDGALIYTIIGFFNFFLSVYNNQDLSDSMILSAVGLIVFMIACPICGLWMDKIGHRRYMLMAMAATIVGCPIVFFLASQPSTVLILISLIILGVLTGSIAGPAHGYMKDLFPVECRYTGVSFGFCMGIGTIGGTTPFVLTYMLEKVHFTLAPGLYISFLALLAWLFIYFNDRRRVI